VHRVAPLINLQHTLYSLIKS